MTFTIFGVIWLLFSFLFFFMGIRYLTVMLLLSMVLQCDTVIFWGEGVGIGPGLISSLMLIVRSFIPLNKIKFKRDRIKGFLYFFLAFIAVTTYVNDGNYEKAPAWIQLFLYGTAFLRLYALNEHFSESFLRKSLYGILIFVLAVGGIQLLYSAGWISDHVFLRELIYCEGEGASIAYYNEAQTFRLYATFMEPSYCSAFLAGAFYFLLCDFNRETKKLGLLSFTLLGLILTFSSTGYVTLIAIALIFGCMGANRKVTRMAIPVLVVLLLYWAISGSRILDEVLFQKLSTGSGMVRSNWNKMAWRSFLESKAIGNGYKNVRGSSLLLTLLGELGWIGTVLFSVIMIDLLIPILPRYKRNNFDLGVRYLLLGVVTAQVVACPDLSFSPFWFAMFLCASAGNFQWKQKKPGIEEEKIYVSESDNCGSGL